ncbi:MAG TPA: hypothetical protein VN816_09645 [Acidimicrobiales bacterium]|nr:hypothetical protein [Acidimicrobiales bacterium]
MSSFEHAWWMAASHVGLSPTAVPITHNLGCHPAPANFAASE